MYAVRSIVLLQYFTSVCAFLVLVSPEGRIHGLYPGMYLLLYSIFINIIQLIPRNYVSIGSSANTPNGEQRIV